jgi:hypothetical protein
LQLWKAGSSRVPRHNCHSTRVAVVVFSLGNICTCRTYQRANSPISFRLIPCSYRKTLIVMLIQENEHLWT